MSDIYDAACEVREAIKLLVEQQEKHNALMDEITSLLWIIVDPEDERRLLGYRVALQEHAAKKKVEGKE